MRLADVGKVSDVKERNLRCFRLVHDATKAEHLHIEADDTENAFWYRLSLHLRFCPHLPNANPSVMFKTVPMNSTGVAHILEHTSTRRHRPIE